MVIINDNYKAIKKIKKTIEKFSIKIGTKPNDNFLLMDSMPGLIDYQPGFHILGVERNHPKRDIELWNEHLNNRGASGNFKQASEHVGECYWCFSEKKKQIVKFLLKCETFNVLRTQNNEKDIEWAIEQIEFIWKKTFPKKSCPEIKVISEKFFNSPADEICCMELIENDLHKSVCLLNSDKVSERINGLNELDGMININPVAGELIFRMLTRELNREVLDVGINLYNKLQETERDEIKQSLHWLLCKDNWNDNTPMERIEAWRYVDNKINKKIKYEIRMKVLHKSKQIKCGDIFTFTVDGEKYFFGRVIKKGVSIGGFTKKLLIYIYKDTSHDYKEIPILKKENLLSLAITERNCWTEGYFMKIGHEPINGQNTFVSHLSRQMDDSKTPYGSAGLTTLLSIDLQINKLLGNLDENFLNKYYFDVRIHAEHQVKYTG